MIVGGEGEGKLAATYYSLKRIYIRGCVKQCEAVNSHTVVFKLWILFTLNAGTEPVGVLKQLDNKDSLNRNVVKISR